jgi:hypothetical protein
VLSFRVSGPETNPRRRADGATPMSDPQREFLRHALAVVAYRGGKTIRNAPPDFASFRAGESTRTPLEILAHIGDLYDWALHHAKEGKHHWEDAPLENWDAQSERFFAAIARLDAYLASGEPLRCPWTRLYQGPIADSLTHFGQIAMLRRLQGSPVKGENYFVAEIETGRVGPDQSTKRREFD